MTGPTREADDDKDYEDMSGSVMVWRFSAR